MTEQEIKEKWFPICQPGNLVKETFDDNHDASFFLVTGTPEIKKRTSDHYNLEVRGIFIGRPVHVFLDNLLYNKQKEYLQTIVCWDTNTLELSSLEEMNEYFHDLYLKEIKEMYDKIKNIKTHIRAFKKTVHSLDKTMTAKYDFAWSLFEEEKEKLRVAEQAANQAVKNFSQLQMAKLTSDKDVESRPVLMVPTDGLSVKEENVKYIESQKCKYCTHYDESYHECTFFCPIVNASHIDADMLTTCIKHGYFKPKDSRKQSFRQLDYEWLRCENCKYTDGYDMCLRKGNFGAVTNQTIEKCIKNQYFVKK